MKHMDLIATYCDVLAVKADKAIWYVDGGYRYADVLEEGEGWVSYSCNTQEEWEMLTEQVAPNSQRARRRVFSQDAPKFQYTTRPRFCQDFFAKNFKKIFFPKMQKMC